MASYYESNSWSSTIGVGGGTGISGGWGGAGGSWATIQQPHNFDHNIQLSSLGQETINRRKQMIEMAVHDRGSRLPDGCSIVARNRCYDRLGEEVLVKDSWGGIVYKFFLSEVFGGVPVHNKEPEIGADYSYPTCKSCKEKHKTEKLDLIGRCSKKLASHNEKLGKLFREHNKK